MDRNSEGMDSNGTPVDDFEFDNNSYTVAEMREMAANVQRENVEQPQHEPTSQRGKGRGSRGGRKESGIKPPAPPNLEKILPRKRKPEDVQPEIPGVGKRTSAVWDHFKLYPIYDKDGNVLSLRALCDHCTKEYSGKGRDGTSNCHNHLLKCKGYRKWKEEIGVDNQSEFDQQTYCEFFAEAILRHGYPLSMVENEGVRKLHSYLNPKVKPISRKTITRWCMSRHELLKGMLMETLRKIDGKVCLTTDIWTACTSHAYLALTCHYIDHKWQLKSKVLNFRHFPPPHTGNETAKLLYSMIRDWGLEKKLFSMTVDNATNMDVMTVRLQEKLQSHSPLPVEMANANDADGSLAKRRIEPEGSHSFSPNPTEVVHRIVAIIESKFVHPWPSVGKVDKEVKDQWFAEFGKHYEWDAMHARQVRKTFESICSRRLKDVFGDARKNNVKPRWLSDEVWEGLQKYWNSPEFKNKSEQGKRNRASEDKKAGKEVSALELFKATHQKKKDSTWVDKKAAATYEKLSSQCEEMGLSQDMDDSSVIQTQNQLFATENMTSKGSIYGMGTLSYKYKHSIAPGSGSSANTENQRLAQIVEQQLAEIERQAALIQQQASVIQQSEEQSSTTRQRLGEVESTLEWLVRKFNKGKNKKKRNE